MGIADRLRYRRLVRLHKKFLDASNRYPSLCHIACRSDTERLWIAMCPAWAHPIDADKHEEMHRAFWQRAVCYSRYDVLCRGKFCSAAHFLLIDDRQWIGRFGDADGEMRIDEDGYPFDYEPVSEFWKLSDEAARHLAAPNAMPVTIYTAHEEMEEGADVWLDSLYELFAHTPEQWDYHPNLPYQLNPGESFSVIGLPCNVFLASARAIELFAEEKAALPRQLAGSARPADNSADSKTDNAVSARVRIPENPDVLRLAKKINERNGDMTKTEIALELTEGDQTQAESLLRQLRRFPCLTREADKRCPPGQEH
ncbi:MAG TPA: hypothetical protein VMY42_16370 [Thermoguttaceae bacterium]|nr:hypothetical protein [Thermoguttaceae bacterium]